MIANLAYAGKEAIMEQSLGNAHLKLIETVGGAPKKGQWTNQLINGDNLPALSLLAQDQSIKGKVRLVYIDPPFATGQSFNGKHSDEIAYDDTLQGPAFLEFLRQRLVLIRELMADDGSIYVHIDTKIGHYVKVLMDGVFGPEHFINDITRIKCNPKNFERKAYGNYKDIILFYSKSSDYVWNEAREEMTKEELDRLFPKTDRDGRHYTTTPLHAPGITRNGPTGGLWKGISPPSRRHWRYNPDELTRLNDAGLIEWSSKNNPRLKIYADDAEKNGKKRQDIWEFKDPAHPDYPTEKNLEMLKTIVNASSNEGDIVLDAFCGSGTTLLASEILHRRWIGIDSSPVAMRIAKKKLKQTLASFDLYELEIQDTLSI